MMKDNDFKLLKSFALGLTDERTNGQTDKQNDICNCRVAFVTEKLKVCQPWVNLTYSRQ